MKKILFSLLTLVCSMSMNAQVMKVMKGNTVVATYTASQADNVVFEEEQASTTGTAKRTGNIDVNWVQLWENGPKFAEYNVGATSISGYGGFYCWGKSINNDTSGSYKKGTDTLTGADDTATNLWGSNWRMPTETEFRELRNYCDVEWTTVNGVNGCKYTGKTEPYKSNSVFFPAAGELDWGTTREQGDYGYYWSSTPYGSEYAEHLQFRESYHAVGYWYRRYGNSVRTVLAE